MENSGEAGTGRTRRGADVGSGAVAMIVVDVVMAVVGDRGIRWSERMFAGAGVWTFKACIHGLGEERGTQ